MGIGRREEPQVNTKECLTLKPFPNLIVVEFAINICLYVVSCGSNK
jgi:hypothetical protein